jgi:hypothetical protein
MWTTTFNPDLVRNTSEWFGFDRVDPFLARLERPQNSPPSIGDTVRSRRRPVDARMMISIKRYDGT